MKKARFMKKVGQPLASSIFLLGAGLTAALAEDPTKDWPFDRHPPREQSWPFNRDAADQTGVADTAATMSPVAEPGDPVAEGSEWMVPAPDSADLGGFDPDPLGRVNSADGIAPQPPIQSGPIRILPPSIENATPSADPLDAPAGDPITLFPAGPSSGEENDLPTRAFDARPGEAGTGIEVGSLGKVDEASVGLLDDNNGGLGATMWAGTDRRSVEQLIDLVPGPSQSPVMGDLSRRLLLTAARPPQGAGGGQSLLARRLQRLNAAGRSNDVMRLLVRAGVSNPSPAAAQQFAEAALAVGDSEAACKLLAGLPVGGDTGSDPIAAFALKLSIFCQIAGGRTAAANLTVDLAREQGLAAPLFLSLAAAATDGLTLDAPDPRVIEPLILRMMDAAGRDLPGDSVGKLAPSVLVSVAEDGALDPELRIAAAERAAALGLLDGDQMAAAYLSVPYSREDVAGVRVGIEPASPYRRRALFHQAILDEQVPAGRADLLAMLFFREAGGEAYPATLAAHRGSLASVPPSSVLTAFAPMAVRAFVQLGDRVRAGMWLSVLEGSAASTRQVRELRAVLRLIDPSIVTSLPMALPGDVEGVASPVAPIPAFVQPALDDLAAGGDARTFAALEIVLLDALGVQLPPPVWDALLVSGGLPGGDVAPLAVTRRLKLASDQNRVGETVLLSLAALSELGPSEAHPQTLSEVVRALRKVGLEREARSLAAEALIARLGDGA